MGRGRPGAVHGERGPLPPRPPLHAPHAQQRGLQGPLRAADARWLRGLPHRGHDRASPRYFDEAIDIHHLFPQKWCIDNGIEAGRYNSIVNKTPLSARTNRMIGGNAPSDYLGARPESAEIAPRPHGRHHPLARRPTPALDARQRLRGVLRDARAGPARRASRQAMGKPVLGGSAEDIVSAEDGVDDDEADE